MASMTTVLTLFSRNGDTTKYSYDGHTAIDPRFLVQQRKEPSTSTSVMVDSFMLVAGAEDADGTPLSARNVMKAEVRRPVNGIASDITAQLATFRDIVNSDEFTLLVTGQAPLKP